MASMLQQYLILLDSKLARRPRLYRLARRIYAYLHGHPLTKRRLYLNPRRVSVQPVHELLSHTYNDIRHHQMRALFQRAILACVQNRVYGWWNYHGIAQANAAPVLRTLLRECVFRRGGDYCTYIELTRRLNALVGDDHQEAFTLAVAEHFGRELDALECTHALRGISIPAGARAFVLGLSVWGEHHIDLFLSYCIPSLMTDGNIGALLRERHPILLIHTDDEGERMLSQASAISRLKEMGISIVYLKLNAQILKDIGAAGNNKYWHLGMMQSLHMFYAKKLQADFHVLLPDHLYANAFFEGVLRAADRGHCAILQTSIRTNAAGMSDEIGRYRTGDAISISPADLIAIGLRQLHPAMRDQIMNDRDPRAALPTSHVLLWEAEREFHIISPHQSVAYLDRSRLERLPRRFYFTIDSEIDKIVPEGETFHCTQANDGMVYVELSPADMFSSLEWDQDLTDYCRMFWSRAESTSHLRFFDQDIVFPVNRRLLPDRPFVSDEIIRDGKAYVRTGVRSGFPAPDTELMVEGLLALHLCELHPQAQDSFAALRETAQDIWRLGKVQINPKSNPRHVWQISRWLWHFDLLEASVECLERLSPGSDQAAFMEDCMKGFRDNHLWARGNGCVAGEWSSVLGATIWGKKYLSFFLNFHLPCLLASGNLPQLARSGRVILSIATDPAGKAEIEAHPVFRQLSEVAQYRFSVFKEAPSHNNTPPPATFYSRYGLIDHTHVYLARSLGADLYMVPPDCLISERALCHFSRFLETYDCCSVACIEADRNKMTAALADRFDLESLPIDGKELLALAARHKTDYFRSLVHSEGNVANAYPRELFWRIPGGYVCHSLFMHPLAVSARMLSRSFHPNHENVDWALLPRLLQHDGKMKVITDAAEIGLVHCSDRDVRANEYAKVPYGLPLVTISALIPVHLHDYPLHRRCFESAQHFSCADEEFPTSSSYPTDIAFLRAAFTAITDHDRTRPN